MEKNRKSLRNLLSVKWIILFTGLASSNLLFAQQSLETLYRLTGDAVTGVFEPQREVIQNCSAVIYNKRDEIAYGVVISKDGYILTKASEIQIEEKSEEDFKDKAKPKGEKKSEDKAKPDSKEKSDAGKEFKLPIPEGLAPSAKTEDTGPIVLSVRVDKQEFDDVKIVHIDKKWDVALIKVDAQDLTPAEFAPDSKLEQGTWVVVNGATSRTKRRVLAGIISAQAREIPKDGVVGLGLVLEKVKDKLQVKDVSQGGGADLGGVKVNDIIVNLEQKKVAEAKDIAEILAGKKPGEEVKLTVKRAGKDVELTVKLAILDGSEKPMDRNDQMSGDFSERRSDFPRVIQHDILANSNTMGGPVLNMQGQVVGMNIARANRCETYAIPVEELQVIAKEMLEHSSK
jgi:S1-C subfamily serine protease